jgi:hypothetical protein
MQPRNQYDFVSGRKAQQTWLGRFLDVYHGLGRVVVTLARSIRSRLDRRPDNADRFENDILLVFFDLSRSGFPRRDIRRRDRSLQDRPGTRGSKATIRPSRSQKVWGRLVRRFMESTCRPMLLPAHANRHPLCTTTCRAF